MTPRGPHLIHTTKIAYLRISGGSGMNRKLIVVVGSVLLVGAGGAAFAASSSHVEHRSPAAAPAVHAAPKGCTKPAPTTAKGYAAMFAALPTSQWGAADTSISVPLADGRDVWLYSDTFEAGRFVHSTAIVQDQGCLHVSHTGAQLLPNDDAQHIYWISTATGHGSSLTIQARAITLTGHGPWDFRDGGHTRTALASVSAAGDVSFVRWTADRSSPAPNPGPMYVYGPHHFGYGRHTHPEARLASGRVLVTTCQNFDDGVLHPFADYRPIFSEG
jgi:hypothetical protein